MINLVYAAETIPSTANILGSEIIVTINVPINNNYYSIDYLNYDVTTDQEVDICVFSRDGLTNISMNQITTTHYDYNQTSIPEGSHVIEVYCEVGGGNSGYSSANFYIDLTNPQVTLINPPDSTYTTSSVVTFELKCTDNLALNNLQLWSNVTGSWALLTQNNSPINNTSWSTNQGLPNGYFIWGAYCSDMAGRSVWSSSNWTLTVNATTPIEPRTNRKMPCAIFKLLIGFLALAILLIIIGLIYATVKDIQEGTVPVGKMIGLGLIFVIIIALIVIFLKPLNMMYLLTCP